MDHGQDPSKALDEGLQFLWTRTREPRTVDLRVDQMLLNFQQAQFAASGGRDPWPALTEALKGAGHAVNRPRDFYGDLLNFKARMEAERGQDPRPTVKTILEHFEAKADSRDLPHLSEICAEAWMTRARWEFRIGSEISATASLHRSQALLQRTLLGRPGSFTSQSLQGQAQTLEGRMRPD